MDGLLRNSTSAARWVYAFTVPPSGGARGILARAVVSLSNAWYRLRESRFHGFRAYVHDVSRIEAGVRAAGFDLTTSGRRAAWDLRVYTRPSEGRGA